MIILRADAKVAGLKRYFTGRPCKRGHIAERYVSTSKCLSCAKNEHKSASSLACRKRWAKNNPQKKSASSKKWVDANRDKDRVNHKRWALANPDKCKDTGKRWRKANPEKISAKSRRRRSRKRGAGGSHTQADLDVIFKHQRERCAFSRYFFPWCTTKRLTRKNRNVDHIVPISCDGTDYPHNLQFLCGPCNRRKGALTQDEFLRKYGLLL